MAKTLRFDSEMEIALFKEVLHVVPYNFEGHELTEAWKKIGESTSLACGLEVTISARTARQKVEQQLKYCKEENRKNLKK